MPKATWTDFIRRDNNEKADFLQVQVVAINSPILLLTGKVELSGT